MNFAAGYAWLLPPRGRARSRAIDHYTGRNRVTDRCEHGGATGSEVSESIAAGGARVCLDCHWAARDAAERRRERIESFFSADPFCEVP